MARIGSRRMQRHSLTVMGICVMKNRDGGPFLGGGMTVAANLFNVDYRHVIRTGQKVRIRSWVEREEDSFSSLRFEISQTVRKGDAYVLKVRVFS